MIRILALAGISISVTSSSLQCSNYDTNMGATFDLNGLIRGIYDPSYIVTDGDLPCTVNTAKNHSYLFNICGTLTSGIPSSCASLKDINLAAAIQIDYSNSNTEKCNIVGLYGDTLSKLELLNQNNPSSGVSLTYYGDYCTYGIQRKFIVKLKCDDKLSPIPTQVYETSKCVYTVEMPTVFGCPMECPVSNRQLCAGKGHCHYDSDAGSARCFCNKGSSGKDCSLSSDNKDNTASSSTDSTNKYAPVMLGLIVTAVIIIGALSAGIVMVYKQVNAYKEDVENYRSLRDEDGVYRNEVAV